MASASSKAGSSELHMVHLPSQGFSQGPCRAQLSQLSPAQQDAV